MTSCKHEGTIKAVKSSSGKHAGKWMCKVKGPKVTATNNNMKVKTLYTAPFLGAAKASIAKFLSITVATVEVTTSSFASSGAQEVRSTPITVARQQKVESKKSTNANNTNEFDTGDDDEFANFDLNAAISSAVKQQRSAPKKKPYQPYGKQSSKGQEGGRKQALPPQHYPITSNYKSSSAATTTTPDAAAAATNQLQKELEELRAEKDRLNNEITSAQLEAESIRQENEHITKETQEAKDEKARLRGQIRAIREEQLKLQSDLNSAAKEQQQMMEKSKKVYDDELDVEKSKLKGQIRALQEQRDDLKCDIKLAVQKNEAAEKEKHEKELKELDTERSKLKGQIRALQEQYDQLKSDIEAITQKKDCAEKETQAALAKKEEYDEEAKIVKKALESHRSELATSLAKATKTATAAGESEPPTKKQKTGKRAKGGTIGKSMKAAELKEEAVARGINVKEWKHMNKEALLEMLVVGSRSIIKSEAWDEVVNLRKTFADERQKAAQMEEQRREELYRKEEQERREQEKKRLEQREKNRADEIRQQAVLHSLSVPKNVHGCKLAFTKDLLFHGAPRNYNVRCSQCGGCYGSIEYSCEKCDYDICNDCFKVKTMTPAEKKVEAKRKAAEEKERQKAAAERRRLQEEEEAKRRKKWDPNTHFANKIVNPSDKNKDPDGNKSKGFTVWCSDGYGNDGWHSYEGAPAKEFDTTYATKKEANERARYLFQWKNPWGFGAEEFDDRLGCSDKSTKEGLAIYREFGRHEHGVTNKSTKDGMVSYTVTPDDSTTWTVSVVPDAAFAYLENATKTRHCYDYDRKETTASIGYWGF